MQHHYGVSMTPRLSIAEPINLRKPNELAIVTREKICPIALRATSCSYVIYYQFNHESISACLLPADL